MSRVYYAEFKRRSLPAPRVATVSYGPYWNLFDKPGPKSSALFPEFVEKAMPFIESRLGGGLPRRYLWGMSQGGYNGSLLLLKRPELWSGAVFSCPGWYTISVFAGPKEMADYISRTQANRTLAEGGMRTIRECLAGPEEWTREDPLIRAALAWNLPPVYVDSTSEDDYGFHEGAQRFVEILRGRGQRVFFRSGPGAHCELDARGAASFLASLEGVQRAPRMVGVGRFQKEFEGGTSAW
jgi:pimeloyl-ACP methyl ester carboxylesterase